MTTSSAPAPPLSADESNDTLVGAYRPVIGDGTTGRSRARARWRRWRWPLLVVVILVLLSVLLALAKPLQSQTPVAPDNTTPSGAQALVRVLDDHGIQTTAVSHTADAVSAARSGTTLLVVDNGWLDDDQLAALYDTEADLVLVAPGYETLGTLTAEGLGYATGASGVGDRSAGCSDPDAASAGRIHTPGAGLEPLADTFITCFPVSGTDAGLYAVGQVDGRTIRVFADATPLLNGTITEQGNAALALNALGHHHTLIWYIPSEDEYMNGTESDTSGGALLPPWTTVVFRQLLLVALVAMFWRGRRLGPLVPEDLPVVVRAAETTRGRGRLYRRSKSRGHAAAGLRAATADRVAGVLGLPRSTSAPELIDAVSRATGRPDTDISFLLYGPPPTDDAALLSLARQLDHIESEVHHP